MTNIIHVASEANPFSKSGGLAEVAGDLPEAQAAQGDTVFVVSPHYKNLRDIPSGWEPVKLKNDTIKVPFYDSWKDDEESPDAGIHDASIEVYKSPKGVYHVLVSPPADHPEYFVNPSDKDNLDKLYQGPDLEKQMAFLCRAALPAVKTAAKSVSKGFKPDVVMGHDWQAGPMGAILRHSPLVPTAYKKARFIQVIHNTFDNPSARVDDLVHYLRLPGTKSNRMHAEYGGNGSFLQMGLGNADKVIAVSPNFAEEIKAGDMYRDVSPFRDKITGIVNGINMERNDPNTDPNLEHHYSQADLSEPDNGKVRQKAALCKALEFTDPTLPLLGVTTRLDDQKNLDLLDKAIKQGLLEQGKGWNVALVGSGDPVQEERWLKIAEDHPGRVSVTIGFNGKLARRIQSGSDVLVGTSIYEPCGLIQLEGMCRGTPTIAPRTGGFVNTIDDNETGFLFPEPSHKKTHPTVEGLLDAAGRAMKAITGERAAWVKIMQAGMQQDEKRDFSWAKAAELYDTEIKAVLATQHEKSR